MKKNLKKTANKIKITKKLALTKQSNLCYDYYKNALDYLNKGMNSLRKQGVEDKNIVLTGYLIKTEFNTIVDALDEQLYGPKKDRY
jgi:hypothetical protein